MRDPVAVIEDEDQDSTAWEDSIESQLQAVDDAAVGDGDPDPDESSDTDTEAATLTRTVVYESMSITPGVTLLTTDPADSDEVSDGDDAEGEVEVESPPESVPTTRWVPIGDLVVEHKFWTNPRRFTGLDEHSIKELANDISAKTRQDLGDGSGDPITYAGIDDPLHVVRILSNGSVIELVVDGQRRHRAATQAYLKDPEVLVPVRDLEPEPVIWTQEASNKYLADSLKKVGLRAGLSAFELAKNAEFLRAQRDTETGKDYTLERIAGIIGRSESWVSKILSALKHATPKLVHKWETGAITEEQFRDLAAQKDPEEQEQATDAVVKARSSGDSGGGRTLAKEQLEIARASRTKPVPPAKPAAEPGKATGKGGKKNGPVVKGPQTEMPAPPPRKAPPFVVVEDMLATAAKRPPTHEYVKGMLDGVRWATGLMDAALLGKPWQQYLQRYTGAAPIEPDKPDKSDKKAKKRK